MISKMNKVETFKPAQTYPIIKISKNQDFAVLFINQKTGVVIWHDEKNPTWKTGFFTDTWNEETFLYTENIFTLSN